MEMDLKPFPLQSGGFCSLFARHFATYTYMTYIYILSETILYHLQRNRRNCWMIPKWCTFWKHLLTSTTWLPRGLMQKSTPLLKDLGGESKALSLDRDEATSATSAAVKKDGMTANIVPNGVEIPTVKPSLQFAFAKVSSSYPGPFSSV